MKKILKVLAMALAFVIVFGLFVLLYLQIKWSNEAEDNLALLGDDAPTLISDGVSFRDLNKNGSLDTYEDARAPMEERIEDLISQMTTASLIMSSF